MTENNQDNAGADGPERGPESGPESGPERGPESGPERGPESGPERGPESGPESGPAGGRDRVGDLDELARQYLDLWQDQLASLSANPLVSDAMAGFFAQWSPATAMSSAGTGGNRQNRTRDDGSGGAPRDSSDTSDSSVTRDSTGQSADRPAAARASPVDRSDRIGELLDRLDRIEERLARLEQRQG